MCIRDRGCFTRSGTLSEIPFNNLSFFAYTILSSVSMEVLIVYAFLYHCRLSLHRRFRNLVTFSVRLFRAESVHRALCPGQWIHLGAYETFLFPGTAICIFPVLYPTAGKRISYAPWLSAAWKFHRNVQYTHTLFHLFRNLGTPRSYRRYRRLSRCV